MNVTSNRDLLISFYFDNRLLLLEERLRTPGSHENVDCILDTVTALIADCDHDSVKRLKNIEAYISRCE